MNEIKMSRPLVVIHWIDSCSIEGWTSLEEIPLEPTLVVSVGWILAETENALTLVPHCGETDGHEAVSGSMTIPLICIKRRIRLDLNGDKE